MSLFDEISALDIKTPKIGIFERFWGYLRDANPENLLIDLREGWSWVSGWFEGTFGVSIKAIIRILGNAVLWILELAQKLIEAGLDRL